jgi:hypothetical protein
MFISLLLAAFSGIFWEIANKAGSIKEGFWISAFFRSTSFIIFLLSIGTLALEYIKIFMK